MATTWYRGEVTGAATDRPGANKHDLGDGLYLTDRADVAYNYAGLRSTKEDDLPSVRYIEFDPNAKGRVLDLTAGPLREQWRAFEQQTIPSTPTLTNRDIMARGGGNYGNMFDGFLRANKIDISTYDMVIGPEYIRGGTQLCILSQSGQRSALANRIDAEMSVGMPVGSASTPGRMVAGFKPGSDGRSGVKMDAAGMNALAQGLHIVIRNGNTKVSLEKAGEKAMRAYLKAKPEIERMQLQYPEEPVQLNFFVRFQPGPNADFADSWIFDGFEYKLGGGFDGVIVQSVPREEGMIFSGMVPALRPRTKALQRAPERNNEPVYQGYLMARKGIEPPAQWPYIECFNVLNGSPMYDILTIVSLLAKDGFLTLMKNTLPSVPGIYNSRINLALYAVEGFGSGSKSFESYKSSFSKDFFALPQEQQNDIKEFFTKEKSSAIRDIVGRWRVCVDKWTWIYDFSSFASGAKVTWRDPFNGLNGAGTWKLAGNKIAVSWAPKSTSTDEWYLPIDPYAQHGKCFMKEGTFLLGAVKEGK